MGPFGGEAVWVDIRTFVASKLLSVVSFIWMQYWGRYVHLKWLCMIYLSCIHAGAGIHVTNSELSYSSSSLPNNSIILVNTAIHTSWYSTTRRMGFYCCSNFSSTYSSPGNFIGVNGYRYHYNGRIRTERYYHNSPYAGCMYIYFEQRYHYQNQLSSSEEGIYTCRMYYERNHIRTIDVNIGIYRDRGESTENFSALL